jgi:hypothetical protein
LLRSERKFCERTIIRAWPCQGRWVTFAKKSASEPALIERYLNNQINSIKVRSQGTLSGILILVF